MSPIKEGYFADKQSVLVHPDGEQEITLTYKASTPTDPRTPDSKAEGSTTDNSATQKPSTTATRGVKGASSTTPESMMNTEILPKTGDSKQAAG
ncbi:hypothetical protein EFE32_07105 [Lactococcus lactis subsp. lactis]|uniref:hypothetical protein n=1 Tax=Lactococcus lactis TaxID=1358 RepID=UPI00223B4640|nr:hypothetical protein [Lactococcus lactis]MCT0016610.1 hypothetical protein [Lactococcus lactis subsp. lactis]